MWYLVISLVTGQLPPDWPRELGPYATKESCEAAARNYRSYDNIDVAYCIHPPAADQDPDGDL